MAKVVRTFGADYSFGKQKEIESLPILNDYFKTTLTHNEHPMCPFDFENSLLAIEQKARHCSVNTYDETMLQYTKIQNCSLPAYKDKERWFIFAFTDGVYGIRYDQQKFQKYTVLRSKIPDRVNIKEKEELRIYIPITDLVFMSGGLDARQRLYRFED